MGDIIEGRETLVNELGGRESISLVTRTGERCHSVALLNSGRLMGWDLPAEIRLGGFYWNGITVSQKSRAALVLVWSVCVRVCLVLLHFVDEYQGTGWEEEEK